MAQIYGAGGLTEPSHSWDVALTSLTLSTGWARPQAAGVGSALPKTSALSVLAEAALRPVCMI